MSSENHTRLSLLEIISVLIFIVGVVFIFVSKKESNERDREIRNALRYQDISQIADALWKISIQSTEYSSRIETMSREVSCADGLVSIDIMHDLLVPEFFSELPYDPSQNPYLFSVDGNNRITVCTLWGEEENKNTKVFSITR